MKTTKIIKATVFTLICLILFGALFVLLRNGDRWNYQRIRGFYQEPEDSLDVVLLGGSILYSTWEAPLAWENYGFTSWSYSTTSQPLAIAEMLLKECRKTQKDALYVITINGISYDENHPISEGRIHMAADYMPLSKDRDQIIRYLLKVGGHSSDSLAEYYFPFLRYHSIESLISELNSTYFDFKLNGLKSAYGGKAFLQMSVDISQELKYTTQSGQMLDWLEESVKSLLDYCDREEVDVLFVVLPQVVNNWERMNAVSGMITSRGYPLLNMMDPDAREETGIDYTVDFRDDEHCNIHGAVKITDYLARYLSEHYDLPDRRGSGTFADWDAACDKYTRIIAPYTLPFEYEDNNWDFSLDAPSMSEPKSNGTIEWETVDNADGYGVFRKTGGNWSLASIVDADECSWTDEEYSENYRYVVAAYSEGEEGICWGRYDASIAAG